VVIGQSFKFKGRKGGKESGRKRKKRGKVGEGQEHRWKWVSGSWVMGVMGQLCDGSHGSWVMKMTHFHL